MQKTDLRRHYKDLRRALSPAEVEQASLRLTERFLTEITLPPMAVVAGYAPFASEINPLPLLALLRGQGMTTLLPVAAAPDQALVFHAFDEKTQLSKGRFGMQEPPLTAPALVPDVVLLPLVAFDAANGQRLGQGMGHYDRTLAGLCSNKKRLTIGLAYDFQACEGLPAEEHDQPLDCVVTPSRVYSFK